MKDTNYLLKRNREKIHVYIFNISNILALLIITASVKHLQYRDTKLSCLEMLIYFSYQ